MLECGKARQAAIDRLQREQLELEAQRVPVCWELYEIRIRIQAPLLNAGFRSIHSQVRPQLRTNLSGKPLVQDAGDRASLSHAPCYTLSYLVKQTLLAVREEVAHVTKVKHPLIPEECFIPYQPGACRLRMSSTKLCCHATFLVDNTSSRARPSKAALAVCAPILTGIINQALLKCFTVDEKVCSYFSVSVQTVWHLCISFGRWKCYAGE